MFATSVSAFSGQILQESLSPKEDIIERSGHLPKIMQLESGRAKASVEVSLMAMPVYFPLLHTVFLQGASGPLENIYIFSLGMRNS